MQTDSAQRYYAEFFAGNKPNREAIRQRFGDVQIIGLMGLEGAGKSHIAKYLVQHHGFTRLSFAAPLRRMLEAIGIGPHFHTDPAGKLATLPHPFNPKTARYLLQTLGTEWGRKHISETIWSDLLEVEIYEQLLAGNKKIVIDDPRFYVGEMQLLNRIGRLVFVYNFDIEAKPDYIPPSWKFWQKPVYHPSREVAAALHYTCRQLYTIGPYHIPYKDIYCEVFINSQDFLPQYTAHMIRKQLVGNFDDGKTTVIPSRPASKSDGAKELGTTQNASSFSTAEATSQINQHLTAFVASIPSEQSYHLTSPLGTDCSSPGDAGSSASCSGGGGTD